MKHIKHLLLSLMAGISFNSFAGDSIYDNAKYVRGKTYMSLIEMAANAT